MVGAYFRRLWLDASKRGGQRPPKVLDGVREAVWTRNWVRSNSARANSAQGAERDARPPMESTRASGAL